VASSDTSLAGKHCLVLDDEFLIALDIQEILEAAGAAQVTCVADAASALAALDNGTQFDLAVLDVILSGAAQNSLTVATVLAARKIPFVFLTGMTGKNFIVTNFPEAPVLEKPYQAPILLKTVLHAFASR
jgi:CheY-like chemotaxis protein